jgi:hypothetical protein
MADNKTSIIMPKNEYDTIMKSMDQSNEYVFSFASLNFSENCKSHLAAIKTELQTSYVSRKISSTSRMTTADDDNDHAQQEIEQVGVAFVVLNGSFKQTLNTKLKQTIIEDGLMIQIDVDTLNKLREALKSMRSFQIKGMQNDNEILIAFDWYKGDFYLNKNVYSPVDGKPMCGMRSIRLFNQFDYMCKNRLLKWTEIFLLKYDDGERDTANDQNFNLNRFSEACSNGFYVAINKLIDELVNEFEIDNSQKLFVLGLRVTVLNDTIKYSIGANGMEINAERYLVNIDNELIPILNQVNSYSINICVEFVFYILDRFDIDYSIDELLACSVKPSSTCSKN